MRDRLIEISDAWAATNATKGEYFSGRFLGHKNDDRHGQFGRTPHTHGTLMPGEFPGDHLGLGAVPKVTDQGVCPRENLRI
jgi:hypothetical protein